MRSFEGTVLFVDMLGFSALTRGTLSLGEEQYKPWKVDTHGAAPHQLLAAKLLLAFRKTLLATKSSHQKVNLAQLSDCAFLWSESAGEVTDAGRHLLHEAALNGLLCRGGLASGSIHEPDKVNRSLGAFIVGDAVTRAATYESAGKGMRVFTDPETADQVMQARRHERFRPLVNPMTGDTGDEWQWYAPPSSLREERSIKKLSGAVERLVGCHAMIRYSPRLAWSATSPEGRRQIACSIAAVSDAMEDLSGKTGDYSFSVEHLLGSEQRRGDVVCKRIWKQFTEALVAAIRSKQARADAKT